MHSFDSLSLKNFLKLNKDFLKNASVQKVQQPSRREVILNIRNSGESRKLYININPKWAHICYLNEKTFKMRALEIPKSPPMFCMQLRKYIEGARIKEITIPDYERIIEFHFEVFDEIGQLVNLCLAVELMGKYSNIILYDFRTKNILGCAHNVSAQKSSVREVFGTIPYIYPPKQNKTDILKTSYGAFLEVIKDKNDIKNALCEHYYYLTGALSDKVFEKNYEPIELFKKLQNIVALEEANFLNDFWGGGEFNFALDNYFANFMFEDIMKSKKSQLSRLLNENIKKLDKILKNPPSDEKANKYKAFGDLIFQYIYLIKEGDSFFTNPETNEKVELETNISPSLNAQKYYTLYSKAKGEFEYKSQKFKEAKIKRAHFEEILFSIENSKSFEDLAQIEEELALLGLLKKEIKPKKDEKITLEKFVFEGYDIYLGKNNKQNDYLISKVASGGDLWFHAFNCPSSHVLIKIKNGQKEPNASVLEYASRLVKENSPLKNSTKASIIYTRRKNLKKPPASALGYVTYKGEKEIVV